VVVVSSNLVGSYRLTRSLRAVQLLLGHSKLESTVRYCGK
jgi:site-specific recombinase XerC